MPRALRGVNVRALGLVWKSSKKAWMNADIIAEWLKAFYEHVGALDVLLLMDNFSAHTSAMEIALLPTNVRIKFLPKNSTSAY
jgi:hypothetical protein